MITRYVILIFLFIFNTAFAQGRMANAVITRDVDGDTVHAAEYDEAGWRDSMKIRMVGMDAPELHLVTPEGTFSQGEFGERAFQELQSMIPENTTVVVEDLGRDRYRRVLGRIFKEGQDINLAMVRTGWAIPYIICEGAHCNQNFFEEEHVESYLRACESARQEGLGIFNPSHPLTEMPFEFRLRLQHRQPEKYVGDYETKALYAPDQYGQVDVCHRIFFMSAEVARRMGYHDAQ